MLIIKSGAYILDNCFNMIFQDTEKVMSDLHEKILELSKSAASLENL